MSIMPLTGVNLMYCWFINYTDDSIAIFGYPMSVAHCIVRICEALEDKWDIL
ncbi:hypothetical protein Pint_05366 [Pistacia integerrima]|uniref:Uncharacterized protein n=1 Tax=Pistacia integerrima TaxID=434235 RepID=A0ACC0Z6V0_9ROSI|nr:hypothetical protein Pint_05366 [Pistacia integerrima]